MKLSERELAYICGFLDGDGSILVQLVHRKDYKRKFQIRVSINFHQKTKRHWFLLQLKGFLKYGSVHKKEDGMSIYSIIGMEPVKNILTMLKPYLRIKKSLARVVLRIIEKYKTVTSDAEFIEVCNLVDKTAELTDSKTRKYTSKEVRDILNSAAET